MDLHLVEDLLKIANDHNVKFLRYEDNAVEVELFEPIREMNLPPMSKMINPEEILKDDLESQLPSDEELKFASTPHYDEINAEKESRDTGI